MNDENTNKEVIHTINSIIESCKDSEEGFRLAAGAIQTPDVRTLFNVYAQQRANFAAVLNNEVLHRGGEPADSGHVAAAIQRGWFNLKTAIAGKKEEAILEECERGENRTMSAYQEALKRHLPADLMDIVEEQYQAVRQTHETLRGLQHSVHAH